MRVCVCACACACACVRVCVCVCVTQKTIPSGIYLAQKGFRVVGFDFSPEAIEIAVQRAANAGMYTHYICIYIYVCIKIYVYIHTHMYIES